MVRFEVARKLEKKKERLGNSVGLNQDQMSLDKVDEILTTFSLC